MNIINSQKNSNTIEELKAFIGRAMLATYVGDGSFVDRPQRKGFKELEYTEGDWYYRDSYAGYIKSVGQEVVWYQDQPIWSQIYGGGMTSEFANPQIADKTFSFLKSAIASCPKDREFFPRGPKEFNISDWKYECKWEGDILDYKGSEIITLEDKVVFTHDFRGGLIDWG